MRAYSIDLRERIVRAVASGQSLATTARRFEVSVKTVRRLLQREQATGSVAPSPDLNPIEHGFSKLKAILRRLKARTRDALLDAIAIASDAITSADAHGWFLHDGYGLPILPS